MNRITKPAAIMTAGLIAAIAPAASAEAPLPLTRQDAVGVIRELRKIVTPQGVDQAVTIPIGGINQFVTIRGRDRRNPILLMLDGGPGFPENALAWWNTRALEEYFTVVHWDQRGSGKTYLINDPEKVGPTMQPERFISDTEDLVGWLRKTYGKDKIFLLGHSWGSYVGLEFAHRHPDVLYAYIGTGQATNTPESERRGYAFALDAAKRAGNTEAVKQLQSIAPYAAPGQPIPLDKIVIERHWSDYFGGVMAYRHNQMDGIASRLSPEYSDADEPHVYEGNGYSQKYLFSAVLSLDLSTIDTVQTPVILLEGRHDRTVNSQVAYEWFGRLHAPQKQFVWFENSGHEVMSEEPGKVLVSLLRYARPIAEQAGDVAPDGPSPSDPPPHP